MKTKLIAGLRTVGRTIARRRFMAGVYQTAGIGSGFVAGMLVHPAAGFAVLAAGLVAVGVAMERD